VTLVQTADSSGCLDSISYGVTINPLPSPEINGSWPVCANSRETYSTPSSAGSGYFWSVSGGSINGSSISESVEVDWGSTSTGTIKLVETITATGCKDSVEITDVIINPLPNPQITSGSKVVCQNDEEIYSSNVGSQENVYWYASYGQIIGSSRQKDVTVKWQNEGIGELKLVFENRNTDCKDSIVQKIQINPLPKEQIQGSQIVEEHSDENYWVDSFQGISYQWKIEGGAPTPPLDKDIVEVKWDSPGEGKVILTQTIDSSGCSSHYTLEIKIDTAGALIPKPGNKKEICYGEFVEIGTMEGATGGVPPYTFEWTPVEGLATPNDSVTTAFPDTTTEYTLKVTDSRPVSKSATITVTVDTLPKPVITGEENPIAQTKEIYMAVTPPGVQNKWTEDIGHGGSIEGEDYLESVKVLWTKTGSAFISLTQTILETGCSNTDTLFVDVKSPDSISVEAGPNKEICPGGSIQIGSTEPASGGVKPYKSFIWIPADGLSDPNTPNPKASPEVTTIYTLTVTDSNDKTAQDTVTVFVHDLPPVDIKGPKNVIEKTIVKYAANDTIKRTSKWYVDSDHGELKVLYEHTVQVGWGEPGDSFLVLVQTDTVTGCTNVDTLEVKIDTTGTLIVNPGSGGKICYGDSLQIGSKEPASGGRKPYTYKWVPSEGLSNDTIPDPMAKPTVTTP